MTKSWVLNAFASVRSATSLLLASIFLTGCAAWQIPVVDVLVSPPAVAYRTPMNVGVLVQDENSVLTYTKKPRGCPGEYTISIPFGQLLKSTTEKSLPYFFESASVVRGEPFPPHLQAIFLVKPKGIRWEHERCAVNEIRVPLEIAMVDTAGAPILRKVVDLRVLPPFKMMPGLVSKRDLETLGKEFFEGMASALEQVAYAPELRAYIARGVRAARGAEAHLKRKSQARNPTWVPGKWVKKGDKGQRQAQLKIIGVPAMHISSYDTEDPCDLGHQTTYVIEARNEGTSPCTNIQMENTIPEDMLFISANPNPLEVQGKKVVFPTVPFLNPGDKLTYKIVVKAIRDGSAKNIATLRYDQFIKPIIDEEGTSVYGSVETSASRSTSSSQDKESPLASMPTDTSQTNTSIATCVDVSRTHWAYDAIQEALPIMQFCTPASEHKFNGGKLVNRYDMARIIVGLMDRWDLKPKGVADPQPFLDVPKSHPDYEAIQIVVNTGILATYDGKFHGDKLVNRYQMSVCLNRLFEKSGIPAASSVSEHTFKDVGRTHWAYTAVQDTVNRGILKGYAGKFHGDKLVNRFQMAVIIKKVLDQSPTKQAG